MGGFMVLLLQALTTGDTTQPLRQEDIDNLPAFVFGDDGEFLGRVDVPVLAGHTEGA
jgi:hypothetical protein